MSNGRRSRPNRTTGRAATRLAAAWAPRTAMSQQAAGTLAWGHIMISLDKLDTIETRESYAKKAVQNAWPRNVLLNQIKNRTLERTGTAPSIFRVAGIQQPTKPST
nr:DUF1016 N-terminal domain-containing protein [Cryobacterium sp. N19]